MSLSDWQSPDLELVEMVETLHQRCLEVYKQDPLRIREDYRKEASIAEGGYGRKQVQELIQNAADALRNTKGRIEVYLSTNALYVANGGEPFEDTGVQALLYSHLSNKQGDEIGRFGLGFKSMCGISNGPKIYSQSVSFGFNRNQAASELEDEIGFIDDTTEIPSLRLAWRLDPIKDFENDEILATLAEKAVTVIKIPLINDVFDSLFQEIREFDESLCLFVPHISELRLHVPSQGFERRFSTRRRGKKVQLDNNLGETSEWFVFSAIHHPSAAALKGAGAAANREEITVSWAVPLTGKVRVGHLCAYFPVDSEITLSGKLNAPWKLSDDRINVIECLFNQEILENTVPALVLEARKMLAERDLGHYLDVLPARGREARSWADDIINEPIYSALRTVRSLPDATGELRSPNALLLLPEEVDESLADEWLEKAHLLEDWAHPTCTANRERRAKARRLIGTDRETGRIDVWLSSFTDYEGHNYRDSINALNAAYQVIQNAKTQDYAEVLHSASAADIVLLEIGIWVRPDRRVCFIRTSSEDKGSSFIDPRVVEDPLARTALELFDIRDFEEAGEISTLLSKIRNTTRIDWESAWTTFRQTDIRILEQGFKEDLNNKHRQVIRVLDGRGNWVLPNGQYISGPLMQKTDKDAHLFVDPQFHAADEKILALLGIHNKPVLAPEFLDEKWVTEYKKDTRTAILEALQLRNNDFDKLNFELAVLHGPLDHFTEFSDSNKARMTEYLLTYSNNPSVKVTNSRNQLRTRAIHPIYWLLNKDGRLKSSQGIVPITQCFLVSSENDETSDIADIFPVVLDLDVTKKAKDYLNFKTSLDDLTAQDYLTCAYHHHLNDDEASVGKTYAYWCWRLRDSQPEKIYVKASGEWEYLAPEQIAVTTDSFQEEKLEALGIPTLSVPGTDDIDLLADYWGLIRYDAVPKEFEAENVGPAAYLTEVFPPLEDVDGLFGILDDLQFATCTALNMVFVMPGRPKTRQAVSYGRDGNMLYTTASTQRGQLNDILRALQIIPDEVQLDTLEDELAALRNQSLLTKLRRAHSDEERITLLFSDAELLTLIHQDAVEVIKQRPGGLPSGIELAELCMSMYGTSMLQLLCGKTQDDFPIRGIPKAWNGGYQAKTWVRSLGFSDEWAGLPSGPRNSPFESVEGPSSPAKFHEYQQQVSINLREMLRGNTTEKRGLVTLPTGAGKTRVTVQSIVMSIADGDLDYLGTSSGEFHGPILWLADNEELCEQAIETWTYIWRSLGRKDTALTISRHFGNYAADEIPEGVQVVVATWQKVHANLQDSTYEWLKDTPLVIIDEAHTALAKSFTEILEWTGRAHNKRDKLLLGLTATPFRGRQDTDETRRLRRRFDDNILDEGVFGDVPPMQKLQEDHVLAQVTMQQIHTDTFIELNEQETKEFRDKHWLPNARAVELGADTERTMRIIDSIKSQPSDWPIIVFAASVDNADTLAALLTLDGVPAASISSGTKAAERKLAISRFKKGELRVLTNFNVLSQGFDAPMTRAVYITRPTTSEVRYQQMIGRGLRGPKNGGTDKVLLVNVLDNIKNFELSIKYDTFEYLASNSIEVSEES